MEITYYGHSSVGVRLKGVHLLFDPYITPNEAASHINIDNIVANYVLLSHGHSDHVTDALAIAQNNKAKMVSNFEIIQWYTAKQGYSNVHPMNPGGSWKFEFGKVLYTTAVHSSSLPDGTYGGNPGGFVVETDEGNFYFAGDTALTLDMQLIPRFTRLDFAFLPIGGNFTMDVEQAIVAAEFIQCRRIIGIHYDTFGFIKIDHQAAIDRFAEAGLELILMDIGHSLTI